MKNYIELFHKAAAHFQNGQLQEAGTLVQTILHEQPDQANANHLAGLIAGSRADHGKATEFFRRAITASPGNPAFHSDLGLSLHKTGRLEEALDACEMALSLDSLHIRAKVRAGDILKDLARLEESLSCYNEAIEVNPSIARVHLNKGVVLEALGRQQEALLAYDEAIRLNAAYAEAYNNKGNIFKEQNRYEESLNAYRTAIRYSPGLAEAHYNLSIVLSRQGYLTQAIDACRLSIKIQPEYVEAYINLGNNLLDLGFYDEAENAYRAAIDINPGNTGAHSNLLFLLSSGAQNNAKKLAEAQIKWRDIISDNLDHHILTGRHVSGESKNRLRIGYISPDFRKHVVNYFFEPLLTSHDRSRFEIFCYDIGTGKPDFITERLQQRSDHWRDASRLDDSELAKLINKDRIDILVDLAGHTANNRLTVFTYRPAPVQVTYLGYFAGTGLSEMDYWITDNVIHPANTKETSEETIYRLPRCWVCYQPPEEAPDVSVSPTCDNQVVFGSFNKLSKLTPDVIETWSILLHKLPGSRLLVMDRAFRENVTQQLYVERFSRYRIAKNRLLFRSGGSYENYLSTYAEVDIILDTFPRTGGTTTAEALWMGVPVVTLAGEYYVERISASKLTAIGLEHLVTYNKEDYVSRAVELASAPEQRAMLRNSLRKTMAESALCDSPGLANAIEAAYLNMWQEIT